MAVSIVLLEPQEFLALAREKAALSREKAIVVSRISRRTWCHWQYGNRNPSLDKLRQLTDIAARNGWL
jgi:transcriptional regulator with XRE-family HTH domain